MCISKKLFETDCNKRHLNGVAVAQLLSQAGRECPISDVWATGTAPPCSKHSRNDALAQIMMKSKSQVPKKDATLDLKTSSDSQIQVPNQALRLRPFLMVLYSSH